MFPKVVLFHSFRCCFNIFNFCWNLYILVRPGGWVVDHQCWIMGLNSGLDNQKNSNLKGRNGPCLFGASEGKWANGLSLRKGEWRRKAHPQLLLQCLQRLEICRDMRRYERCLHVSYSRCKFHWWVPDPPVHCSQ
jgi:hypothetical protein